MRAIRVQEDLLSIAKKELTNAFCRCGDWALIPITWQLVLLNTSFPNLKSRFESVKLRQVSEPFIASLKSHASLVHPYVPIFKTDKQLETTTGISLLTRSWIEEYGCGHTALARIDFERLSICIW
jgi:hypothetical protein